MLDLGSLQEPPYDRLVVVHFPSGEKQEGVAVFRISSQPP